MTPDQIALLDTITEMVHEQQLTGEAARHLALELLGQDTIGLLDRGTPLFSEGVPASAAVLAGATRVLPAAGATPASPGALAGKTSAAPPSTTGPKPGLTIMGNVVTATTVDITSLPPGAVFDGRYSVVSTLGVGGMGAVYQAVDTQLNQLVALKALRPAVSHDSAMVDILRQEVSLAQKLNHPNLLTLRHLDTDGDAPYVIMELMDGGDLQEHLASRGGQLSPDEALAFLQGVLSGLSALHAEKIAHLDVKPSNILLSRDGRVKLADFGISSRLKDQRKGGLQAGTPEYAPPEQLSGKAADVRADIYAVGILLHELLSGRLPFEEATVEGARAWHQDGARVFPLLPSAVAEVVAKATAIAPGSRYRSARAMWEALEAAVHQKPWTVLDAEAVSAIQGHLHGEVELPDGSLVKVPDPGTLLARGAAWPTARTLSGQVVLQTHGVAMRWIRRDIPMDGLSDAAREAAIQITRGNTDSLIMLAPQPSIDESALALLAFHAGDMSAAIRRLDAAERAAASVSDRLAICAALAGGLGTRAQLVASITNAQDEAASPADVAEVAVAARFLLGDQRQTQRLILGMERAAGTDAMAWLSVAQVHVVAGNRERDITAAVSRVETLCAADTQELDRAVRTLPPNPSLFKRRRALLLEIVETATAECQQRGLRAEAPVELRRTEVLAFQEECASRCAEHDRQGELLSAWRAESKSLEDLGISSRPSPTKISARGLKAHKRWVKKMLEKDRSQQAEWHEVWTSLNHEAQAHAGSARNAPARLDERSLRERHTAVSEQLYKFFRQQWQEDNDKLGLAGLPTDPWPDSIRDPALATKKSSTQQRIKRQHDLENLWDEQVGAEARRLNLACPTRTWPLTEDAVDTALVMLRAQHSLRTRKYARVAVGVALVVCGFVATLLFMASNFQERRLWSQSYGQALLVKGFDGSELTNPIIGSPQDRIALHHVVGALAVPEPLKRIPGWSDAAFTFVPHGPHTIGCSWRTGVPLCPVGMTEYQTTMTRPLAMMTTEVSAQQWAEISDSGALKDYGCDGPSCPATGFSWIEAVKFANAVSRSSGLQECYRVSSNTVTWVDGLDCQGFRLPSEHEWEIAARAGADTPYPGSSAADDVGWGVDNANGAPHTVGMLPANPWGLHDMAGNVAEFTWDGHQKAPYTSGAALTDPIALDRSSGVTAKIGVQDRVLRGGSWSSELAAMVVWQRLTLQPSAGQRGTGMRLVRTLPTVPSDLMITTDESRVAWWQPGASEGRSDGKNSSSKLRKLDEQDARGQSAKLPTSSNPAAGATQSADGRPSLDDALASLARAAADEAVSGPAKQKYTSFSLDLEVEGHGRHIKEVKSALEGLKHRMAIACERDARTSCSRGGLIGGFHVAFHQDGVSRVTTWYSTAASACFSRIIKDLDKPGLRKGKVVKLSVYCVQK